MNVPLLLSAPAYTGRELAKLTKVTPRTIYTWRHQYGLPYVTLPGGMIRYPAAAVDNWLRTKGVNLTPHEQDLNSKSRSF
jgi:excisionase family DNA binding protein